MMMMMMSSRGDALISSHTSWVCTSPTALQEVLIPLEEDLTQPGVEAPSPDLCAAPVVLEREEESSPCLITLLCRPGSGAVIYTLQVLSEARTVELYSLSGDYCGTSRGQEDQRESAEQKHLFYTNRLLLPSPLPSCRVKLLSLGGRSAVAIRQVVVGLRFHRGDEFQPDPTSSIDLQRVQAMMQEMGTTLSPGAQNLLDMVEFQQKNRADVLAGFLPLLMGGGGGGGGGGGALASFTHKPKAAADDVPAPVPGRNPDPSGSAGGNQSPVSPDLLPLLQSVCGHVTQLRLRSSSHTPENKSNGERDDEMSCGALEKLLEKVVEKRIQDLEARLMERMDARLDALQQRLELTLHQLTHTTPSPNS